MPDGRAALVTGGARRLGRAIALALAREGFDIALHFQSSAAAAKEVQSEIEGLGVRCELFQAEFGPGFDAHALVNKVVQRFSHLSVLINNVSVFERGTLLDTDDDLFDRVMAVNLRAPFFLSQAFAIFCESGLIVNLLDTRVAHNAIEHFVYTLSKKALREFTRMAAVELAPNFRVNAVCPGLILPPHGENESYLVEKAKTIPARRHGSEEDIARAVLFFVNNPFVTGQELFVDGGEHLL